MAKNLLIPFRARRFSQDLGLVDAAIPISTFVTIFAGLTCIAQAIYICISSRYLVIVVVACIFVLYLVQTFYLRTSRQLRIPDLEATGPLVSQVLEAIQGHVTINALGWDTAFQKQQLESLDRSQRAYYLLPMVQRWLGFVLDMTVTGIAVVLVSLTVFIRGSATSTFLGAGLTGVVNFALNMNMLIQNWTVLETVIQAIWRIKVFSEDTPSEGSSSSLSPPENWPSAGRVTFQNVYASYVYVYLSSSSRISTSELALANTYTEPGQLTSSRTSASALNQVKRLAYAAGQAGETNKPLPTFHCLPFY